MTVTAGKIGKSPLLMDWTVFAESKHGFDPSPVYSDDDYKKLLKHWDTLKERFDSGEVGFFDAPDNEKISQVKECRKLAEYVRAQNRFKDVLFIGIGGSSLGPASFLNALSHRKTDNAPDFHFLDNPDGDFLKKTVGHLKPESTLVVPVTKSGGTFETLAIFMLALDWIGTERWKSNVIAITDEKEGDLRAFANHFGIPSLNIGKNIGGRFSIFSPVGLFPMALAGHSICHFLQGASEIKESLTRCKDGNHPLFILADLLLRHGDQRSIHVCMPYSNQLSYFGKWWGQLWGESLGKDGKGFTPVAATGTTDQHSILQLLRDGPDDKVTFFITVNKTKMETVIPKALHPHLDKLPAFQVLQGAKLDELMHAEYRATAKVLARGQRPHATFQLEQLDEHNLGALYFSFSVLTAYLGTLMEVNPFDQPGVEEGKVYTERSLSQMQMMRKSESLADDDSDSESEASEDEPGLELDYPADA